MGLPRQKQARHPDGVTASLIREALLKAKDYMEQKQKAKEEDESVDFDFKCESLIPLLERKIPAHFHAHRADDIFTAIRIAKEFNLDFAIIHCTEGHLIAPRLARKDHGDGGPAMTGTLQSRVREQSFRSPGSIGAPGCRVSLTTEHPATPIQYLPLCAAMAAKAGMDKPRALAAITCGGADLRA
jgi:imidazolonepropionase-like amidohydrolase